MQTFAGPCILPVPRPLPAPTLHPSDQTVVHVPVDAVELPVGISRPEVVAPAPEHGIQARDDFLHVLRPALSRIRQFVDALPDPLHRLRRRPSLHEVKVRRTLDAAPFPDRTAKECEPFLAAPQVDNPGLLRVQHKAQTLHDDADAPLRFLCLRLRFAHHYEVVGIPHQESQVLAPLLPDAVKVVQVDVGCCLSGKEVAPILRTGGWQV